jgi:hypothetical protein
MSKVRGCRVREKVAVGTPLTPFSEMAVTITFSVLDLLIF